MTIRGHFNGKVVVLDEPADLRPNQRVTVSPESVPADAEFGTMGYLLKRLGDPIGDDDARAMTEAIDAAFEQVEPERDLGF